MISLLPHQATGLKETKDLANCAYYWSMGLGKTFVGSEKLMSFNNKTNVIVCQKSKINDWLEHMSKYYPNVDIFNLTKPKQFKAFQSNSARSVGVINYDLLIRRKDLSTIKDIALLLDESSLIKNDEAKRTKAIFQLNISNVVLLSGTPVGGKYEELYSQCKLLGWDLSKKDFWDRYIYYSEWSPTPYAKPIKIVRGYKNVDELKTKLREYGANFLSDDGVLDLPKQNTQFHNITISNEYNTFLSDRTVEVNGKVLRGDTQLTMMLGLRQLCSIYSEAKKQALIDILESTSDRVVIFYNFNEELEIFKSIIPRNKMSVISGPLKTLAAYDKYSDSVTCVQYQAGAMGLNLQKASRIIYYSLPLSSELFEQSKKRIHRIGQTKPCYYHYLICSGSIEEDILDTLNKRNDYTVALFEK